MNNDYVHVVIPTLGYSEMLQDCVDSIEKYTTNVEHEILIINTKSKDPDTDINSKILNKYSNVKCKNVGYYNFAKNNNEAILGGLFGNIPDNDYVLFCNNDIEFKSNCIELMLDIHKTQPIVGTVGAMLFFEDGSVQHAGVGLDEKTINCYHIAYKNKLSKDLSGKLWHKKVGTVIANTAALMLIKVETFKKLNGFNEEYKICFEDLDLNLRATLDLGLQNYISYQAYATHKESVSRGTKLDLMDTLKIRFMMAKYMYEMAKLNIKTYI